MIAVKPSDNKQFAENLLRTNMSRYFLERNIEWDPEVFARDWLDYQNYEILIAEKPIGVIRMSIDNDAFYIRDIQIKPEHQSQGFGSLAIEWAIETARQRNFKFIRLRVFHNNPALMLYKRLGFKVKTKSAGLYHMERYAS